MAWGQAQIGRRQRPTDAMQARTETRVIGMDSDGELSAGDAPAC